MKVVVSEAGSENGEEVNIECGVWRVPVGSSCDVCVYARLVEAVGVLIKCVCVCEYIRRVRVVVVSLCSGDQLMWIIWYVLEITEC